MITVLGNRVLVKIKEKEEKNQAGLFIPETIREQQEEGIVYAVGEGEWHHGQLIKPIIQEGDRVFFGKQSGVEIKQGEDTFQIFHVTQIHAILRG